MLTKFQVTMLEAVKTEPLTTRAIAEASWARSGSDLGDDRWRRGSVTFDRVHASMSRLENRGLVRRSSTNPVAWELTSEGKKEIS